MAEGQIIVEDSEHLLEKTLEFHVQLEKAWTSIWTRDLKIKTDSFDRVIISGMGGSGIAGALLADLYGSKVTRPITTWADYGLPGWADARTLLIAVSYSGETEEELDSVKVAVERKMPIVAVTSGGKLEEMSGIHGIPLLKIDYKSPPRAALGHLYGSLLALATKIGLIDLTEKLYFQAVDELKKTVIQKHFLDKAEDLAVSLNNKVPIIMAYSPLSAVAKRYQNQLNENSKTFALAAPLPEACHNIIVGTEFAVPEKLQALLLESRYGFSRNIARKKVLEKIFSQKDIPLVPLSVKSGSPLAEQFLFLHFGDLLSFYLAGVYGVDPTPTEVIEMLKTELTKL
ncbi:MAG: Bifunctional phosphoglucose/phosphomannose isomerase [Berkelbacteria bacterium GW2011_GWA2_46_7]|uniref:Bifunctional phosphoglucose/phosphomannose isomerase n=1 Tax=Berkelbacteria bacterium GW2011_GWA2_46_7 TaxID=1618335 RepID=A0A0G1SNB5_9BACT|nr:MAG: Bifunctional phosphoglucose/phosphomannose isomerase [Berkelbacteria bacterium GW2011_GWA2_46_7]